MPRKRLNKKVALIGSVVFVLVVLAAIGVVLRLSQDPEKFIKDGDAAVKAAREAADEQIKEEKYEEAERNYQKAGSLAETDSLKVEMLFKLMDIYIETDEWRKVLGCWNRIIKIDPENARALYGRLKFFYIRADSGARGVWQEVESQGSKFIELAESSDLLGEDTAQWEFLERPEAKDVGVRLGPYLYLVRGRANLEIARLGAITDPEASLSTAIDDLQRVIELEPDNVEAYEYLARAHIAKGQILASKGNLDEKEKAAGQAQELLNRAAEVAGADPSPSISLLKLRLEIMLDQGQDREQLRSLEPEYLSLVEQFDSSAAAYAALAGFYERLGPKSVDKAIEAVDNAVELDREDVVYAMNAAELHYRGFSVYGQNAELYKAVQVAENALTLPDAQDKPGPRQQANIMNKLALYLFLAHCYVEQVLEPCDQKSEAQSEEWLAKAERAVAEIEQIFGSGEDPQVIKWQGMLELAKGNRNIAIRKLYTAYEQLKASILMLSFLMSLPRYLRTLMKLVRLDNFSRAHCVQVLRRPNLKLCWIMWMCCWNYGDVAARH
ncbi:MAG: tetratricopeptide repeat protein [Planctomycetota bacterium]|jgi:tetratricopeptide (TPR) repeat protein